MEVKLLSSRNITTIGIGGVYRVYFPQSIDELRKFAGKADVYFIGGGSNTVLPGSLTGLRLVSLAAFNKVVLEGNKLIVGAGARLSTVIRFMIKHRLSCIEFLAGIPRATIGGAVAQNAGAFGMSIKDVLCEVRYVDTLDGSLKSVRSFEEFSYRSSPFPEKGVVFEVVLDVERRDVRNSVKRVISDRLKKQPPFWLMTAGSVFKNPSSDIYAGYLIDSAGLKGFKVGDIVVSEKHANFFINLGEGTFGDFASLVRVVRRKVEEIHDIRLELEVKAPGGFVEG